MFYLFRYFIISSLLSIALISDIEGEVKGRIINQQSLPLKNNTVSLASDSLVVRMTGTNDKGYFKFNKLPKGNYRILIMITGYEKYTTGFFSLTDAKPSRDFGTIEIENLK
ncbi:MAG: carboxypeptidase-like regulatory domain-containing protein [Bacteroidia bacterium]